VRSASKPPRSRDASAIVKHQGGLRAVALFEAFKGALVLIAGFGLARLVNRDVEAIAEAMVHRLHLDAAKGYPRIFLELAQNVSSAQLWMLAALAAAYSTLRFVEAFGLWRGRRWAEWLAALSGAIYVPVEIYELARRVTWIKLGALVLNAAVVAYMIWLLASRFPSPPSQSTDRRAPSGS
jgi:uncharacterized membrane protein (DUF2068 family)